MSRNYFSTKNGVSKTNKYSYRTNGVNPSPVMIIKTMSHLWTLWYQHKYENYFVCRTQSGLDGRVLWLISLLIDISPPSVDGFFKWIQPYITVGHHARTTEIYKTSAVKTQVNLSLFCVWIWVWVHFNLTPPHSKMSLQKIEWCLAIDYRKLTLIFN